MAITDIQISEELETNAPSIKYRGNEGPKSPQEMQQMMMSGGSPLPEEPTEPVLSNEMAFDDTPAFELEELKLLMEEFERDNGRKPTSIDDLKRYFYIKYGKDRLSEIEETVSDRQMAAYGGIMGLDGRRKYGFGSIKKRIRKLIPNEVAKVAEVAAPFVAPFNPIAAGLMSGIGGFDRTGRIGSSIKSGLMNYGLGQGARYLGGAGFQGLENPFTKSAFSSPIGTNTGIGKFLDSRRPANLGVSGADKAAFTSDAAYSMPDRGLMEVPGEGIKSSIVDVTKRVGEEQSKNILGDLPKLIKDNLSKVGLGNNLVTGLLAGGLGASALMGNMTEEEVLDVNRGKGLDVEAIRTEVLEAMKDPSGEALKAIRAKYPFLGTQRSKDVSGLAMGGRIGRAEGGLMDLGGMEKDYRAEGGFVPIGREEKADDVPARLSVNEFVMTADAVRGMGDGDIDLGAKRMENLMGAMENKKGAQQMFDVSERLSEVV
jgi:hypothetical protein